MDTARRAFAETGYEKATVRGIASAASVDPALIRHYFGTKADLFRAAMGWPFEPAEVAARLTAGDPAGLGERLTRFFFEAWEQPRTQAPLLAIMRGAATHDESAALVREFLEQQLYAQLTTALPGPDAALRLNLAMGQLLGIAYLRHILRVEPLASEPVDNLVARVSPVITGHLTPE
ncbi:TetR family transcriptional regulator [Nocardia tengchongensis]